MAYRSSSINIICSYLFILTRSSVSTTEVVCATTRPEVKLGGVICRGQVLQDSVCSHIHINLAWQLKAWKMKQHLGWWHNQWSATMIPPTLTSQKQPKCKSAIRSSSPFKTIRKHGILLIQEIWRLLRLQITYVSLSLSWVSFFSQKPPLSPLLICLSQNYFRILKYKATHI